jgi:hypothetical protein
VSCQVYGKMASSKKGTDKKIKAEYIDKLAKDYPGLRIAYVDADTKGVNFSVLLKYVHHITTLY